MPSNPEPLKLWWHNKHHEIERAYVPGTAQIVTGGSTQQTWEAWTAACKAQGITVENEFREFSDCACRAAPIHMREKCCSILDENGPVALKQRRLLSWSDVGQFLRSAFSWFKSGECVSQELANQRAETCRMCPEMGDVFGSACASCTGILSEIGTQTFQLLGGKTTPHDHALKSCQVCACQCRVIVHAPLDVLLRNDQHEP